MNGAGELPLHFELDWVIGGLYSILRWSDQFNVAKILAIRGGAIHVAVYREQFSVRPSSVDSSSLSFGSIFDELHGSIHIPLQANLFAQYEPHFIQRESVVEEELCGYRTYLEYNPDGEEGAFGPGPERIN